MQIFVAIPDTGVHIHISKYSFEQFNEGKNLHIQIRKKKEFILKDILNLMKNIKNKCFLYHI